MCGIAGLFNRSDTTHVPEEDLRNMLGALRHRGPDESGILLDKEIGLGNTRLSIIDLEGGSQPIANEDETLWIVFNGEIFNYLELRSELEGLGHRFSTSTDTEVILHLFEELGPGCLQKLNGQFAIAIWDTNRRRLFLARDRLGVRPLFYTQTSEQTLIFASEIKAILESGQIQPELDPGVVGQIFLYSTTLSHQTVFRDIVELPPGHFLLADRDRVTVQQYWQNQFPTHHNHPVSKNQEAQIVEEFRTLLIDACKIRLRADVPVGAYLSGGLDSSAIASILRKHTPNRLATFSIAFTDPEFDQSRFQNDMAAHLGTDHRVVRATHADIGRVFPDVLWHTETPLMHTAPASMFLLSKLARENQFKVVLTGEGANEFLAGHDLFKEAKIRRFWARNPQSKTRPLLLKRLYPDSDDLSGTHPEFIPSFFAQGLEDVHSPFYSHSVRWRHNLCTLRFFNDDLLASKEFRRTSRGSFELPHEFVGWEPLAQAQHLETSISLSQYRLSSQCDRVGMAHSVETRFPFLDFRLVEFCNQLPPPMKMRCLNEKWLLKKAASSWLPPTILRHKKPTHREPIHRSFFNETTPDYVRELLSGANPGMFKQDSVRNLVKKIDNNLKISEADDMALAGILSTLLIDHLFIKNFRHSAPLSPNEALKVCRLNQTSRPDASHHPL